ncbi:uncharacterized protein LOC119071308 [Bradysia coprophila]|uniref:uncharacterized protein LOC119071308 n=1 Tax=Bradysia coprophila TaxID=38358 RepID=UPI00187D9E72|nr:uncharacterized protein LOC119071308 [Bradysia coprophila]
MQIIKIVLLVVAAEFAVFAGIQADPVRDIYGNVSGDVIDNSVNIHIHNSGNNCKGLDDMIDSGSVCTIINRKWSEYLYPVQGANYDCERRQIFTWIPGGCDSQCNWKIERSGNKFRLKSLHFDEYLYAVVDSMKYDKQRRNTFSWIPRSACDNDQCYWKIELLSDDCSKYVTIKNVAYNEYLYAADGLNYDKDRRRVFTWTDHYNVANDQASHWEIKC